MAGRRCRVCNGKKIEQSLSWWWQSVFVLLFPLSICSSSKADSHLQTPLSRSTNQVSPLPQRRNCMPESRRVEGNEPTSHHSCLQIHRLSSIFLHPEHTAHHHLISPKPHNPSNPHKSTQEKARGTTPSHTKIKSEKERTVKVFATPTSTLPTSPHTVRLVPRKSANNGRKIAPPSACLLPFPSPPPRSLPLSSSLTHAAQQGASSFILHCASVFFFSFFFSFFSFSVFAEISHFLLVSRPPFPAPHLPPFPPASPFSPALHPGGGFQTPLPGAQPLSLSLHLSLSRFISL